MPQTTWVKEITKDERKMEEKRKVKTEEGKKQKKTKKEREQSNLRCIVPREARSH